MIVSKMKSLTTPSIRSHHKMRLTGFILFFVFVLIILICAQNKSIFKNDPLNALPRNEVHVYKWKHPHCNCTRDIAVTSPASTDDESKSNCGPVSDIRGPHQRVLSFAFYGDIKSDYFLGIARNAKVIAKLYPGWLMRLYHDISPTNQLQQEGLCKTVCAYPFLDDCYIGDLESRIGHDLKTKFGMLWRFVPLGDPLVDILSVRDLDSTVYQREVDAVNQWLSSDKTWHAMRDHPAHHMAMLGGGWGVKNSDDLKTMDSILFAMLVFNGEKKYGYDEWLLEKIAFPVASKSLMAHDSFLCKEHPNSVPFPTQRVNRTFIIDHVERNPGLIIKHECPVECRPADHKDWLYC